jgi:tetratricopeptide (TPR) repeat protein
MTGDPVLKKALALTRRGKFDRSIKMLEGEVFRYQESFPYYHILGLNCLYAGDFGGAFTYFNRAKNIKFRETGPLLGIALYFLKRGDTDKAVDLYLDVQDIDPGNRTAKKALALVRKSGGESLETWIQSGKAVRLYPPIPGGRQRIRRFLVPSAALLCAVLAAGGVYRLTERFPLMERFSKAQRAGMETSVLAEEERSSPVETGGAYRYVLTRDEVVSCYNEARSFFNEYHDEKAKRSLNRLLESNASAAVKNKARLLKSYTAVPGFDTLKDRFSYAEVLREPLLYRDCYVVWKGMAANLEKTGAAASFDLLVGYDTRTVMEGTVHVQFTFPADINTALPLEVLGKVVIVPGTEGRFTLEAAGIHQRPSG